MNETISHIRPRTAYERARDRMNQATRTRYNLSKLDDGSTEYAHLQAAFDRYMASLARRMADLAEEAAEAAE